MELQQTENKRLLTDMDLFKNVREVMEQASRFYQQAGYIASEDANKVIDIVGKAQDVKTLREVGEGLEKVMRVKVLTDDEWVYTIPKSFVEALKQGKMSEQR